MDETLADLVQAIIANPADDVPRLVAADLFEDNGDSERAEFIRVQCELARLDATGVSSSYDQYRRTIVRMECSQYLSPKVVDADIDWQYDTRVSADVYAKGSGVVPPVFVGDVPDHELMGIESALGLGVYSVALTMPDGAVFLIDVASVNTVRDYQNRRTRFTIIPRVIKDASNRTVRFWDVVTEEVLRYDGLRNREQALWNKDNILKWCGGLWQELGDGNTTIRYLHPTAVGIQISDTASFTFDFKRGFVHTWTMEDGFGAHYSDSKRCTEYNNDLLRRHPVVGPPDCVGRDGTTIIYSADGVIRAGNIVALSESDGHSVRATTNIYDPMIVGVAVFDSEWSEEYNRSVVQVVSYRQYRRF